ncbi:hypothetical protein [Mycolicibacterium bacteremicum]|uniref:hypothetical protein n=1 Tax=Mycolicibacterium bacteremicum TaxID=564198 RepID=UPI0013FD9C6B|nr:hypothetical protein [Mycolicibacterium bacteremicum]MCV7433735.1 hypothetical protein [Mycolicibacterium bacteremicum]
MTRFPTDAIETSMSAGNGIRSRSGRQEAPQQFAAQRTDVSNEKCSAVSGFHASFGEGLVGYVNARHCLRRTSAWNRSADSHKECK